MNELDELINIVSILRSENGCNWDKKQTFLSLREYILEESFEVIEAVDTNNIENLKEELGDVLFNIFFFAQIASEENKFQISDVAKTISEKLIRRHPHIFDVKEDLTPDEVLVNWNKIKEIEKKDSPKVKSILDSVPKSFSSLMKAEKIQNTVSKVGFDFENISDAKEKLKEEISEFIVEIEKKDIDKNKIEDEFGDVLFSLVNIARFMKVSPEIALNKSITKFQTRFQKIESILKANNQDFSELNIKELDILWEQVKKTEHV